MGDLNTVFANTRIFFANSWIWLNSETGRNIIKCSIAYLLASMATFITPISNFLGQQDGKHIVATMCVYFHPGRSAGSIVEADALMVIAVLYATFISISSMAVSVLCETQLGQIELGYLIVLTLFCGGGLGFVGWVKQKMGSPLVNVACSLTSLAIIVVLTKENAVQTAVFSNKKIFQVFQMMVMASIITTGVNLILWPVYARQKLRQTLVDATDGLGEMLSTITQSFLEGSEVELRSSAFLYASRQYKAAFTKMKKDLKEAKAEHYVLGTENLYKHEAKLVSCMQKLEQAIGGLRSAAMTQFSLLREAPPSSESPHMQSIRYSKRQKRSGTLPAIDEAPDETSEAENINSLTINRESSDTTCTTGGTDASLRTPEDIFNRFIMHLGPSMKSLAWTLVQILRDLPFGEGPQYKVALHEHFKASLTDALKLYTDARQQALEELYRSKDLSVEHSMSVEADFEEVAASCGHFSFNLQDFAEEMQTYLMTLEELKDEEEKPLIRTWSWLGGWNFRALQRRESRLSDPEQHTLLEPTEGTETPKDPPDLRLNPKPSAKAAANASTPALSSLLLHIVRFLERDDIRFAIKVGIGATLWAMFAFIPETRPIYAHWRGEWGLLSFMLVCSMTIGAANTTGYARFVGTLLGAITAAIAWLISGGNPFVLAFCGWLICLVPFYMIVAAGKAPLGRFFLLTYNLSALYAYSLSRRQGEDDDDEGGTNPIIGEILLHRVVAVLAGCLWGIVITRVIWPVSARQKFKDGLAMVWLRMGLIWKRDPLSAVLDDDPSNAYMSVREEQDLQRHSKSPLVFCDAYILTSNAVSKLDSLRSAASSEFELRGPFPQAEYTRIIECTHKMLDAFHSMNVVIQKDLKASEGEAAILKYTTDERIQLSARISHLFQVIASSMKLEYPINDAVPSVSTSRDRLLSKVFQFRMDQRSREDGGPPVADEDYTLVYTYALVTGQLADEIQRVEKEIEGLFGVLDEEVFQMY